MKKELIIKFNIIQFSDIEKQDESLDLTIYSVNNPDDNEIITDKEIDLLGVKKMMKPIINKTLISDRLGKTFSFKITKDNLEELFSF